MNHATLPQNRYASASLLVEAHRRLCALYGCPVPFFHSHDALSELVSSLLSHRTRNHQSGKAFKALKTQFVDWAAVRDAPVAEVEAAIAAVNWPEQKAPRLQAVLRQIGEERGELSLEFLRFMPVEEARAWLRRLPGVGPKTSAAVLLFSDLRMRAMPVDSHHHRVAIRLGIIGPKTSEAAAHVQMEAMLPPEWDAVAVYDHHEVMMFHGQRCCFWRKPNCSGCVLLDACPTGQARLAAGEVLQKSY